MKLGKTVVILPLEIKQATLFDGPTPPNVTGKLHLGHAWDTTFQDVIARYKKARGYDVLWLPGMDHAGIATQAVVEAKTKKSREPSRYDLGREAFLVKAWEWKDEYASTIRNQWKQLGA